MSANPPGCHSQEPFVRDVLHRIREPITPRRIDMFVGTILSWLACLGIFFLVFGLLIYFGTDRGPAWLIVSGGGIFVSIVCSLLFIAWDRYTDRHPEIDWNPPSPYYF